MCVTAGESVTTGAALTHHPAGRPARRPVGDGTKVIVTISSEGWVDFPPVPEGVELEVYDFGSETKTERLVQQELEEALGRVRARPGVRTNACGGVMKREAF